MADIPDAVDKQVGEGDALLAELEREMGGMADENPGVDGLGALGVPPDDGKPAVKPDVDSTSGETADLKRQLEFERHRNNSLQGRVDSQLIPLQGAVKTLTGQVEQLTVQKPVDDGRPAYLRYIQPEEVEHFGKDTLDAQHRVSKGVTEAAIATAQQAIAKSNGALEARLKLVEDAKESQATDSLWDKVDRVAPGAKIANTNDPGWFRFLGTVDPASGLTYRDLGGSAAAAGDVGRLAEIYKTYKPTVSVPDAGIDANQSGVAPVKARGEPDRSKSERGKPTISQASMEKFFKDVARGKYLGREKEAERIERAIDDAVVEGRVS